MDHGAAECLCGHIFVRLPVAAGHADDIAPGGYIGNIFDGKHADHGIASFSVLLTQHYRFHWRW